MHFANNSGVRINYKITGEGPPLILQHGLTSKLDKWDWYGYVDELKKIYRVISVDARGHGKSDKPYDAALYDRKIMASDIISVLDREDIGKGPLHGLLNGRQYRVWLSRIFSAKVSLINYRWNAPIPSCRFRA